MCFYTFCIPPVWYGKLDHLLSGNHRGSGVRAVEADYYALLGYHINTHGHAGKVQVYNWTIIWILLLPCDDDARTC